MIAAHIRTAAPVTASLDDLIDDLNSLMAEEAEASLRYFQMRFRVRGRGRQEAEHFFEEALKETLDHANEVAAQIKALGRIPKLRVQLALEGSPIQAADALAEALDVEQQALTAYEDFLPRTAGHPELEAFIARQVATETEHVRELRRLLDATSNLTLLKRASSEGA